MFTKRKIGWLVFALSGIGLGSWVIYKYFPADISTFESFLKGEAKWGIMLIVVSIIAIIKDLKPSFFKKITQFFRTGNPNKKDIS